MLNLNEDKLVKVSVIGEITSPLVRSPYQVSHNGELKVLPSTGGITYNVRIGDNACGLEADHVEPGVTIKNPKDLENGALNTLSCIGNTATIVSGDAKGTRGYVTGKHGGCEHIIVDFEPDVLHKLIIGDKIQIKSYGVGLEDVGNKDVKIFNIDPRLLQRMKLQKENGKIKFPVTHFVPSKIMGSGIGKDNVNRGDYDIQLFDKKTVKKYNLDTLKFGDFIAITDADHSYGRIYKQGAISIGVVVHSDCIISGHGPGVTTVMTSANGKIEPYIDETANLVKFLHVKG